MHQHIQLRSQVWYCAWPLQLHCRSTVPGDKCVCVCEYVGRYASTCVYIFFLGFFNSAVGRRWKKNGSLLIIDFYFPQQQSSIFPQVWTVLFIYGLHVQGPRWHDTSTLFFCCVDSEFERESICGPGWLALKSHCCNELESNGCEVRTSIPVLQQWH